MLPAGSAVSPIRMGKPEIAPFNITVRLVDERPIELSVDGRQLAVSVARHRDVLAEAVATAKLDTGARS